MEDKVGPGAGVGIGVGVGEQAMSRVKERINPTAMQ